MPVQYSAGGIDAVEEYPCSALLTITCEAMLCVTPWPEDHAELSMSGQRRDVELARRYSSASADKGYKALERHWHLLVEDSLWPIVGHGVPVHLVEVRLQLLPGHVLAPPEALPHDAKGHRPRDDLGVPRGLHSTAEM